MNYMTLIINTKKLGLERFQHSEQVSIISDKDDYHTFRVNGKYVCIINAKDKANVKVRCDCIDFKFTFAFYNYKNSALDGEKPEEYVKKTNRPSKNPHGYPGVCKHLIACINKIRIKL